MTSFLCLFLILGAFLLIRLNKNDAARIKRQLGRLEGMITLSPKERPEPLLSKIREAKRLISPDCQVIDAADGLSGPYPPQRIAIIIERLQHQVLWVRLLFYDIKILFSGKKMATIHCTARLKGETRSHELFDEFRELKISVRKTGGHWQFFRFEEIEAMEK